MDEISLTIAIPTFNRSEILQKNIEIIKNIIKNNIDSQITISLLVVDNGKTNLENWGFEYIRNHHNIGGDGNVLRLLDFVESDYIWILGDDDFIDIRKIQNIVNSLKKYKPDWMILSQGCDSNKISAYYEVSNVLLSKIPIQDIIFVSTNIYKISSLSKNLTSVYNCLNMHMPHFLAFCIYGNVNKIIRLEVNPFIIIGAEDNLENRWAPISLYIDSIFDFLYIHKSNITAVIRLRFLRKVRKEWLTNRNLVWSVLQIKNFNFQEKLVIFYKIMTNLLVVDGLKIFITAPIVFTSIFFQKLIIVVNNKLKTVR